MESEILKRCPVCNHDSHESGKCKQCNCGENDVVRSGQHGFRKSESYGDYINRLYINSRTQSNYKVCR